ncbi:MAG: UPF0164 family protein [Treponema sp.]|jgi:tetratricopeptide (TPR) repeat protein|nr:UPF0164 family protein [Treponema sp.]
MGYRKIPAFFAVFLLFSQLALDSHAQDFYGNIADYLNNIYKIDDNAGLTAFPVLNIPIGGRAEGMAGAFSAISDDVSFIEFNPAGSSMLAKSELAFFHNNWIADTNIEGIAYATRFGNLGIAAGAKWLYTPFTEYNIYGERVSNGYYSEGVGILNASYNFLSSYYFSGISVGMNLKAAFRMMPDFTDNWDTIISGSGREQSAVMGMADLGALYRFNLFKFYTARERNASAAFVIRNLGPASKGEALPTTITAGIAYKPFRPLLFSMDFNLPVNLVDISLSQKPTVALGFSANVTKFLSMRTGFLYRAGSSRFTVGSAVQLDRIALDLNYTLDLLTQLQPLNRLSIGARLDLGDGGRQQRANRVEELYLLGLEAFARGNFSDARICWEEAYRLDPKYVPVEESLAMLNNREGLIMRIEDLYRFDF